MYDALKQLMEDAEKIGKIETVELHKYKRGWVEICGTVENGEKFSLRLVVEEKEDGD